MRLYHFRDAKAIADALNPALKEGSNPDWLYPIGTSNDLLVILPPQESGKDRVSEIKRYISLIDLPRPQLILQVWSMQVSSKNPRVVEETSQAVRKLVDGYDGHMTRALQKGWNAILEKRKATVNGFFNPVFQNYLTKPYIECTDPDKKGTVDQYCLGYTDALSPGRPSLMNMLLFLAAAASDQKGLVDAVLQEMRSEGLRFSRFEQELRNLLEGNQLPVFRTAILDFLYHYKWTIQYKHDFVPYDLQRTAHALDSLLTPVADAFNRDLVEYIEGIGKVKGWPPTKAKGGDLGFSSRGLIRVAVLSGSQSDVEGKVINYFDVTSPLTLSDILKSDSDLSSSLQNVLRPKEILLLSAFAKIASQPRAYAEIGRGMHLIITPNVLDTASSAELNIDLAVGEGSAPEVKGGKEGQVDTLDRVSSHTVKDHVRVESLKLFEVSAFDMDLRHQQTDFVIPPIGQVWEAVFGPIPGFGQLFRLRRPPLEVDNRSWAMVQAMIVPTAMDLGLSLRFELDRVYKDAQRTSYGEFKRPEGEILKARGFHKKLMGCILNSSDPKLEDCSVVQLSKLPRDASENPQ